MVKMKRICVIVLALALILVGLVACSKTTTDSTDENGEASVATDESTDQEVSEDTADDSATDEATDDSAPSGEKIKIGASTRTLRDTMYVAMMNGAMDAAEEKGVEIEWLDCNIDPAVQVNQVENFLAQKVDVMILEAADEASLGTTAARVHEAGIPVICIEGSIGDFDEEFLLTSNAYDVGVLQVEAFIDEYGTEEPANVVLLSGTVGDSVAALISQGVRETVDKYDNLTIVYEQACLDWARDKGFNYMEDAISKLGGDIQAVFGNNDQITMGALKAAENAGIEDDIWFIGGDHEEEIVSYILDGYNVKTIDKGAYLQGQRLIEVAIALANGEDHEYDEIVDNTKIWYTAITLVDANNVNEHSADVYPDLFN